MKITINHEIDVTELAYDCGRLRQRTLKKLEESGIGNLSFDFEAYVSDNEIDCGAIVVHSDITMNFDAIASAIGFPFDMGDYKILTKEILDALDRFAESREADEIIWREYGDMLQAMADDYGDWKYQQMKDDSLCA